MNHLETLTAEWLDYNGYFVRTAVKVSRRKKGGWDGELDVVALHPGKRHFLHVECSLDAWSWPKRMVAFKKRFRMGRKYAPELFAGMDLPAAPDQVVVHGYASAPDKHRQLGGGRLVTSNELMAEILNGVPPNAAKNAVPQNYPLVRTLQFARMAGARIEARTARLIRVEPAV